MKRAIIVMVRVPELGKVKTRIAAEIGNAGALKVYEFLLRHTAKLCKAVAADTFVFYAPQIAEGDIFDFEGIYKKVQVEGDLGLKMLTAFETVFAEEYNQVCIIGSDCYELSVEIIQKAFSELSKHDVVFGPTKDGGYYLLGQNTSNKCLFQKVVYSEETTLEKTTENADIQELSYTFLKLLSDVDFAVDINFEY